MIGLVEKAPHLRKKRTTFSMMMELLVCLLILYAVALVFYFLQGGPNYTNTQYGLYALQNLGIGVAFAVLPDFLWYLSIFVQNRGDTVGQKFKEYFYKIIHSYSYISGIILVLLLPIGLEWYEIAISAFFAVFVGKLVFGGFGSNVFNPAIVGRVFAQLVFSSHMTTYLGNTGPSLTGDIASDISAGATIPGLVSSNGFSSLFDMPLWKMFLGDYYGALGETFAYIIIILGIYLAIRKIIDWRITLTYVVSLYVASLIMFIGFGAEPLQAFEGAFRYILMGGILFGGVFCLTDPVTSPTSRWGKIIFALVAALFTLIIRLYTSAPEGVAYSILIANLLTPLIDKCIKGRTNRTFMPYFTSLIFFLAVLAVGAAYGFTTEVVL